MINTKKFDELFCEKKEYLFSKTKNEIEPYIYRDNNQNITTLILNLKDSELYKNMQKVIIYFAAYNNRTKEYLDYSICGTRDFTEEIIISKNHSFLELLNKFINYNTDISFKFLIVPIINENKEYIYSLEKYFYKSENFSMNKTEETINKIKYTLSLLFYKIFPFFILVLIPANIYNFLINNLGFVDSLIDISRISTSFIYLLNETISFLIEYIIYLFIGMIIFIPIYAVLSIYFSFYFYFIINRIYKFIIKFLSCKKENENEIILEKINLKRAIKDAVPLLKLFKTFEYYFLSSLLYILSVLLISLTFFISQIKQTNNINNNSDTIISISAYQYMQYSAFPKMTKIKLKDENNTEKTVLFMGYDQIYSYYYDDSYINDLLFNYNKDELEKLINKYNSIFFQDIFKIFLLGKIKNINISIIKNDMYDFSNIDNFKIDSKIFLEKRKIEAKKDSKLN